MDEYNGHVELISRNDDQDELQEMHRFLAEAQELEVDHLLTRLFYDSKACLCIIDTADGVTADHPDAAFLSQAARRHISQFELFGIIGHRQ
jgi:hypothetical protein